MLRGTFRVAAAAVLSFGLAASLIAQAPAAFAETVPDARVTEPDEAGAGAADIAEASESTETSAEGGDAGADSTAAVDELLGEELPPREVLDIADAAAMSDVELSDEAKARVKAADARLKLEGESDASSLSAGFDAGNIISDENFYAPTAMHPTEIQSFLNQRVPNCEINSGPGRMAGEPAILNGREVGTIADGCLKNVTWSTSNKAANQYCDAYQRSSNETSASVIYKVGKACGISSRVLLVLLEKEQSLVTDTWPTTRQFEYAMGAYCPDSGPGGSPNCDPDQMGYANQVYEAARLFKYYQANNGLNYNPGRNNTIQWHPNAGCGTSSVHISNMATASLYTYTPYRPNQAALNAGWGTGDSCSSYGNRNFYQFYKLWFGQPNTAFPDVPKSNQFYDEIDWMVDEGIATGSLVNGQNYFRPKDAVSREAAAAFLYRLAGSPSVDLPATSPFPDVPAGHRFYEEIMWMSNQRITTGSLINGKRYFRPKDAVSREAMAAFLYRYADDTGYVAPASSRFVDVSKGDQFFTEISWIDDEGITTGSLINGQKYYRSKDAVSREAAAAFLYRMEH